MKGDERPQRATGMAASVGIGLLELFAKNCSARLLLFVAGVSSHGPGQVVGLKLEETIRSHRDIFKGNAPHFQKALEVSSLGNLFMGFLD